ncbi:MAG: hypothetical protein GF313_02840, partial [Caldithrix sp.]|nr:hypothetical protein [Caldithrix sp.]
MRFKLISWLIIILGLTAAGIHFYPKIIKKDIPVHGGQLNAAILGKILTINPFDDREFYNEQLCDNVLFPKLIRLDLQGRVRPRLARSWAVDTSSHQIIIKINNDYRWNNGDPLTAYDVRATYHTLMGRNELLYETLRRVQKMEVLDSSTCVMTYKADRPWQTLLDVPVLPESIIGQKTDGQSLIRFFEKGGWGCGPYVLDSFTDEGIVLSANPYFRSAPVYFDTVAIHFYEETDTLLRDIEALRIDVVYSVSPVLAEKVESLPGFRLQTTTEPGYTCIAWNLAQPHLQSRRLRQLLTIAMDRQTMVDGILLGYGTVNDVLAYPGHPCYAMQQTYAYNEEKAKTELNNLLPALNTGNEDGLYPALKLITNKENEIHIDFLNNITQYIQFLGIEVENEVLQWETMMDRIEQGAFDGVIMDWVESDELEYFNLFD